MRIRTENDDRYLDDFVHSFPSCYAFNYGTKGRKPLLLLFVRNLPPFTFLARKKHFAKEC